MKADGIQVSFQHGCNFYHYNVLIFSL